MSEIKKYLQVKLEHLANKFKHVQILYSYNPIAETHIVQLTPQSEYYNNKELDTEWLSISVDFIEKFPYESLSFVSDDLDLLHGIPELEYNTQKSSTIVRGIGDNVWFNIYNHILVANISNLGLMPSTTTNYCAYFAGSIRMPATLNLASSISNISLRYAKSYRHLLHPKADMDISTGHLSIVFGEKNGIEAWQDEYSLQSSEAA